MLNKLWKKKASMMVGIDIGSHAVKAVLLSQGHDGYNIEGYARRKRNNCKVFKNFMEIEILACEAFEKQKI